MNRPVFFVVVGYLSGSILFARILGKILNKSAIIEESPDKNPGTFNAFRYGGFACGVLTLCGDLLKGFLPVYLYLQGETPIEGLGLSFVLAAPVLGHILPVFHKFEGGKGIAASFGCLLGLLPEYRPVLLLAFFFILFSVFIKITPNYHRTLFTYLCSVIAMGIFPIHREISLGFAMVAGLITVKLMLSEEKKEKCKVETVWKR